MTVYFEWDVETVTTIDTKETETGEILEHYHCDTYEQAISEVQRAAPEGSAYRIVLVRDRTDKYESLVCRSWAYIEDGKLPEHFEDAYNNQTAKVPAKFHKEVARA